jgi:hypothetical protein
MQASPVMSACTAVVAEPPGSDEGGNTKTAVSIFCCTGGSSGDEAESPKPSVSEAEDCGEKDIGLSIIAMHLATKGYGCMPLDGVDGEMCFAVGNRCGRTWSCEDIIKLHDNFSGKSSSSTEYLESLVDSSSEIGCGTGPVIDVTRLPRTYIPPATAAVRQKPWAISPEPP